MPCSTSRYSVQISICVTSLRLRANFVLLTPDGRAYAVDEFYKRETTEEDLAEASKDLQEE
jgi:hypothetical protein